MTTILSVCGLFSANFATPVSALSLTLTVPSDALSLDIQPTSTFTKSSPSSVSVKTDAFAGYSLSIKAQSSNELVNGSSKLTSIGENQSEEQYQGEGNLNTWGYKPSKFNSSENTLFLPGPTTSPSVIETTKAANNDAATSYEFVLAAKADATIAQGAYKNTFIFSATANTVSYNIKYELNSGSWSGTSPQTGSTAESTVTLDSHTPTRTSYEFKGWCPKETHDENCSTTSYQPGNAYQLSSGDNNITLWAMWKPTVMGFEQAYAAAGKVKHGSYYAMQDMTSEICNNVTVPSDQSTATLVDTRDNNTYTVAKLKDGKCWMTQNLAYTQGATYTTPKPDTNKYGSYYTWSNAQSKCPQGWTVPSPTNFVTLVGFYNSNTIRQSPASFVNSGEYYSNRLYEADRGGRWWANKSGGNCSGVNMFLRDSTLKADEQGCSRGSYTWSWSLRCISN